MKQALAGRHVPVSFSGYRGTIGDRTMIIDQCNSRFAQHFKHAEKVEVEIPCSVHLLKKKKWRDPKRNKKRPVACTKVIGFYVDFFSPRKFSENG